jgi:hypothetical protein
MYVCMYSTYIQYVFYDTMAEWLSGCVVTSGSPSNSKQKEMGCKLSTRIAPLDFRRGGFVGGYWVTGL